MTTKLQLRPYQEEIIERTREVMSRGKREVIIQMMMGLGKTELSVAIMNSAFEKGYRAIFFAHRRQLVQQTAKRFEKYGIPTTILMAGHDFDPSANLVIASQQTFESRKEWLDKEYALVFFDEAHIGIKRQKRIIEEIREFRPNIFVIGLTATPMTNQGPGMGSIYSAIVHGPRLEWAIEHGYLVEPVFYMMQPIDWRPEEHIKINSSGEYDVAAVERWTKENYILGHVVQNYQDNFMGKRFIVFARSVKQSIWIAEEFGKAGIPVAHIDFSTPDKVRRRIIEDYRSGKILGLSNVDIFSEGFDVPDMEVAILATPMRSPVRYIQRVGRVLRPAPGKEKAIVVDHGGVIQEHGTIYHWQDWELEPPRPDRSTKVPVKGIKKPKRERVCPICNAVFNPSRRVCPQCGYDFNRLQPGEEPDFVPAVMVRYQEALEQQKRGTLRTCRGVRKPVFITEEQFAAELLGLIDEMNAKRRVKGKRLIKPAYAEIIFYATLCECPRKLGINIYSLRPSEPSEWTRRMWKRFIVMQKQGYFRWKKFPCWRS